MARVKEVTLAGQSFQIASLTLEQVEELFPRTPQEAEELRQKSSQELQDMIYQTICYGLNNAYGLDPEDMEKAKQEGNFWDKARIRRELDMVTFPLLQQAILEHSGLAVAEVGTRGEIPAAMIH